jgi:O-antigen/teichoic acid export membrane protein
MAKEKDENEESSSGLFTSISRKSLIVILNFAITGLIGIISWKLVSTSLPQLTVGIVQFSIGFLGLLSFVTTIGFGSSHIKRISEGKDLGRCIGTYLTLQGLLNLVFIAIVLGAIFSWKFIIGKGFETPQHENTVYLMILYFVSIKMADVPLHTFTAKVETAKNQFIVLGGTIAQLAATTLVVFISDSPYMYAATFIVGSMFNFLVSYYMLSKYPIKGPKWNLVKSYSTFALPITIVSLIGTIPTNIDKVMIQLFWDADSVAIYTGGQKFSFYLIQISMGIGLILFPVFSSLKSKENRGEIKRIVHDSERTIVMIMAPIAALLFSLSIPIVTILGDQIYRESYLILQPLAVWGFLRAMITPYRNLIMGIGKTKVLAIISIISVSAIIIFNIILIPKDIQFIGIELFGFGARGAALATLFSTIISFILFRIMTFKYERVFMNLQVIRPIIVAIIIGIIIHFSQEFVTVDNLILLIIFGIFGVGFYFMLLFLVGGIKEEDRKLFRDILDPSAMLKYIKDEFLTRHK